MSGWSGTVLVKLNVAEHGRHVRGEARRRSLEEMAPGSVASEPVTPAEMVRRKLPIRPAVVVSSAVPLGEAHDRLRGIATRATPRAVRLSA